MAGIHADCPYREVVHIETRVGPRGGEYWWLTLACGHRAARPMPDLEPAAAFARGYSIPTAPRRVKCLFCGE